MSRLNKKGEEVDEIMILFFYIFLMAFIAGGLYAGEVAFYGKGHDVRDAEASILLESVKNCLDTELFTSEQEFYQKCEISQKVLEDGNHLVYIKDRNSGKEFFIGVLDFRNRCDLIGANKKLDYPFCPPTYSTEKFDVLVGTSQNSRRVAI